MLVESVVAVKHTGASSWVRDIKEACGQGGQANQLMGFSSADLIYV